MCRTMDIKIFKRGDVMNLYRAEIDFFRNGGYEREVHYAVAENKTTAEYIVKKVHLVKFEDLYSVSEVLIDGYDIAVTPKEDGVKFLETSGWLIKVGQVYSSPYESYHLLIDKIVMSEEDSNPENAMIHGTFVEVDDYSKKVEYEGEVETESFRVWFLNDQWGLERDV